MRNDLSLKCALILAPWTHPNTFSYHLCQLWDSRKGENNNQQQRIRFRYIKRITLPANISINDIALQHIVLSWLVSQSNIVSFHTTIMCCLLTNRNSSQTTPLARQRRVCYLQGRLCNCLLGSCSSGIVPYLFNTPITASPLHSNCLHYCICSQIKC